MLAAKTIYNHLPNAVHKLLKDLINNLKPSWVSQRIRDGSSLNNCQAIGYIRKEIVITNLIVSEHYANDYP